MQRARNSKKQGNLAGLHKSIARVISARLRPLHALIVSLLATCAVQGANPLSGWEAVGVDEEYVVRQWQTPDGLPQNSVNAIAQTPDGYLWLGTFNGLVRFDGVRFKTYTSLDHPELVSDHVTSLQVDDTGKLWISTDGGGISIYNRESFWKLEPDVELDDRDVMEIDKGPDGRVWLRSMKSIYVQKGSGVEKVAQSLPDLYPFLAITFGPNGEVWTTTRMGLRRLNQGKLVLEKGTAGETDAAVSDLQNRLWYFERGKGLVIQEGSGERSFVPLERSPAVTLLDERGRLWLGGNGNKLRFLANDRWHEFRSLPVLLEHDISSIYPDAAGNIWVGTDGGGLVRLRKKSVQLVPSQNAANLQNTVTIAQDKSGRIWSGRLGSSSGVDWIDPSTFSVTAGPEAFNRFWPSSVYSTRDGNVWIGTFGRGLFRWSDNLLHFQWDGATPFTGTTGNVVRVLFEDSRGDFWIGTDSKGAERFSGGRLERFTQQEGLLNDRITAIAETPDGAIWLGTGNGISRLETNGTIRTFTKAHGLGASRIHCAYVDSRGKLWVGTAGGGLSCFTGERFLTLRTEHGLVNEVVAQIIEDDDGHIWIGTNRGISRLLRREVDEFIAGKIKYLHAVVFSSEQGMRKEECGGGFQPATLKDSKGRLWFTTVGGLVVVNPAEMHGQGQIPRVHIEEVSINGRELPRTLQDSEVEIEVPPGQRTLEIQFTAIDFGGPEKISFHYKLLGYDEQWVNARRRRNAIYTKLPPGKYDFRVKAASHQGIWSQKDAALRLHVLPHWWQTKIAKVLGAAMVLGAVGWFYHLRRRSRNIRTARREEFARKLIESQERERQRVSRELHDSIGQSLLVIKNRAFVAMQEANGAAGLRKHLEAICEASGDAVQEVRQISQALRPLQLERLGLTRTIEGLIKQVGDVGDFAMEVNIRDVDDALPEAEQIHFLRIIQEALNNVLKHSRASSIVISIKRESGFLELTMVDDGCGFDSEAEQRKGAGLGLTVISERVTILRGQLQMESSIARGTLLRVKIPIRQEKK